MSAAVESGKVQNADAVSILCELGAHAEPLQLRVHRPQQQQQRCGGGQSSARALPAATLESVAAADAAAS